MTHGVFFNWYSVCTIPSLEDMVVFNDVAGELP